jgi:hypothetical protein
MFADSGRIKAEPPAILRDFSGLATTITAVVSASWRVFKTNKSTAEGEFSMAAKYSHGAAPEVDPKHWLEILEPLSAYTGEPFIGPP